jgi:hypothetical protein
LGNPTDSEHRIKSLREQAVKKILGRRERKGCTNKVIHEKSRGLSKPHSFEQRAKPPPHIVPYHLDYQDPVALK